MPLPTAPTITPTIARSLTEAQGGAFRLSVDGDLFRVDVELPAAV